jgi:hypothetical protein
MTSIMASSLDTLRVLFLFCLAPLPTYLELLRFFCSLGRPTVRLVKEAKSLDAVAVAIGGKADLPICTAYVR